jgi:hypothetical protein
MSGAEAEPAGLNEILFAKALLADAPARIASLASGQMLTLVGIGLDELRQVLEVAPGPSRRILQLDFAAATTTNAAIDRVLDDLADLAFAIWPTWYGTNSVAGEDVADVLQSWRRAAGRLAGSNRWPRFRHTPSQIELAQLLLAIDR